MLAAATLLHHQAVATRNPNNRRRTAAAAAVVVAADMHDRNPIRPLSSSSTTVHRHKATHSRTIVHRFNNRTLNLANSNKATLNLNR